MLDKILQLDILDEYSTYRSPIHRVHPVAKIILMLVFVVLVVSYDRYEISNILPYFIFPMILTSLSDVPIKPIFKRILIIEPFIIFVGILNPLFDKELIEVYGILISQGWLTFISILLKSTLLLFTSLIFISTTGISGIASGLRTMKVPKIFIIQLLLTYRYISILLKEVSRMQIAYSLRNQNSKSIKIKNWGPFIGHLLLRTFDRADRLYSAMKLRGFDGDHINMSDKRISVYDLLFLFLWLSIFVILKFVKIPMIIENMMRSFK